MKIIAEIGVNHGGDLQTALQLVEAAAGADAVKIQMFDPERLDPPGERRGMLTKLILPHPGKVRDRARELGMEFWVTPFDPWMLERARKLEPDMIKVASGSLSDSMLLNEISEPCVMSTGMATIDEVWKALIDLPNDPVCIMHCVSAYPCKISDANLQRIVELKETFPGISVGYSDHTGNPGMGPLAVALGAEMIEAHICLPGYQGPDAEASLEPVEFRMMMDACRLAAVAIGQSNPEAEDACKVVKKERDEWRRGYSAQAAMQGR